jgi:uncharacterized protein YprB with RNaseH-like and TPR domain
MSGKSSLEDKLKALGVHIGTNDLPPQPVQDTQKYPIEKVVEGHYEEVTHLGKTFVVNHDYPDQYQHGNFLFSMDFDMQMVGEWAASDFLAHANAEDLVFLDTETSGLSIGTSTFAFMIGLGYFHQGQFRVCQLFMNSPHLEPALLVVLDRVLQERKIIVTFNGKSFDMPLLVNRHKFHRIGHRFDEMEHVDMLQLARKLWRDRLPSRRLGDLETYILNFHREGIEVPGWMVPMLYKDYLFSGDARPLEGVFYHNQQDIVSLAALFIYSAELLNDPTAYPEIHDIDIIAIARLYEDLGKYDQSIQLYEKGLQGDLPVQNYIDTLMRFALLHKRQKNWREAIYLWQRAVEFDQVEACVSLAKYYEHEIRDFARAISWTTRGILIVEKSSSNYVKAIELEELNHRLERLHRKNSGKELEEE